MLYRAVGKVLCVVPAAGPRGDPVNVRDRLRHIRSRKSNLEREREPRSDPRRECGQPVRLPHRAETVDSARAAAAMRPRPGIDTNVWEHDRAALHELYLLGPRRDFGLAGLRRLLAFLQEQRTCN